MAFGIMGFVTANERDNSEIRNHLQVNYTINPK